MRGDCVCEDGVLSHMSMNDCSNRRLGVYFEDNRRCGAVISYSREVKYGTRIEFDEERDASLARGD
jgi:hypothetical protein